MVFAQGRMRKKLLGASEALRGGVQRVYIGNASLPALLDGAGTTISASATTLAGSASRDSKYDNSPVSGDLYAS